MNKSINKLINALVMTKTKLIKSKHKLFLLLLIAVCILAGFLGYHQFLYKSKRVNTGIARFDKAFTAHKEIVTAVRFAPADSLIITGSVDSTIKIWDKSSGRIVRQIHLPIGISYLDLSTDGKYIATGSYDSKVRLWDFNNCALLKELVGPTGTIWAVAFNDDGTRIATSGDDAMIHVWDVQTGRLLQKLKGHERVVWSVKFSPDGTKIASGSFDYTVKLWNVSDGKLCGITGNTRKPSLTLRLAMMVR